MVTPAGTREMVAEANSPTGIGQLPVMNVPNGSCARASWSITVDGQTTGYTLIISIEQMEFLSLHRRQIGDRVPVRIQAMSGLRIECMARISGTRPSPTPSDHCYVAELSEFANGHKLMLARVISNQQDQCRPPSYFVPSRYPMHAGDMVVRV